MASIEFTQISKRIKLYAINVARESSLTPQEKLHLFRDFAEWSENLAERILLSDEIEKMITINNK